MADRRMWKMSPERLQEHLKLRSRASRIPDKKRAFPIKRRNSPRRPAGTPGGPFRFSVQKTIGLFPTV